MKLAMEVPRGVKEWPYSFSSRVGIVDTHCHLDFLFRKCRHSGSFADFRKAHAVTFPRNYEGCVAVFCDPETFKKRNVWRGLLSEEGVWGAFGCHPHMARLYNEDVEDAMIAALEHPRVVALGEIGLDYSSNNKCDHLMQQRVFRAQLHLARNGKLPLVIHSRDASMDTLRILKEEMPVDWRIHRHCFTGEWTEAQQWLDAFPNLCIGLTPLLGFRNAGPLAEVGRKIPLDRLLLETDAPYFLPNRESGRLSHSHPGMAVHVATTLSSIRGIPLEDILGEALQGSDADGLWLQEVKIDSIVVRQQQRQRITTSVPTATMNDVCVLFGVFLWNLNSKASANVIQDWLMNWGKDLVVLFPAVSEPPPVQRTLSALSSKAVSSTSVWKSRYPSPLLWMRLETTPDLGLLWCERTWKSRDPSLPWILRFMATMVPRLTVYAFPRRKRDFDPNWIRLVTKGVHLDRALACLLGFIKLFCRPDDSKVLQGSDADCLQLEEIDSMVVRQ
ncbi:hypothetical protein HPB52_013371 [Rhipicephalus sanguineus]|uniref:Uncharacterized protein n=1 Tax=Rhipicephalus sanguineus TaxID=34632 RepID=A0A9D4ST11_RHISA|nr:hypothetical protein HPB52_013371 [Rhipicephalus sanguineus]